MNFFRAISKAVQAVLVIAASCLLLTGCLEVTADTEASVTEASINEASVIEASVTDITPDAYMIDRASNYFDYQPGFECSAFASAYLLRHYGVEAEGLELFENFPGKLSAGGVMPQGLVTYFQSQEYEAEYICDGSIDDLKEELAKGAPVIVFIHVEEPYTSTHNTHYVPLVGYDEDYFYLAESLEYLSEFKDETDLDYNRRIELSKFEKLWENIDSMWDNPYFRITLPAE